MHGIYSVGMRFFHVYDPWSSPVEAFDLAEGLSNSNYWDKDVNDYIYIGDAVDALM